MINSIKLPSRVRTITDTVVGPNEKPQALEKLTQYVKDYIVEEACKPKFKNDAVRRNEIIAECKIACKLAVKIIQEAKNHKGNVGLINREYYGKLQSKEAIRLYHILVGEPNLEDKEVGECKKAAENLDMLCKHMNTVIPNRKLSLWGTNYTNHAEQFRQFVDNSLENTVNRNYHDYILAEKSLGLLIQETSNKGLLLAHLVNFEMYRKNNDMLHQSSELTAIRKKFSDASLNGTFVKIHQLGYNERVMFQVPLLSKVKQIMLELADTESSEYQEFLFNLVPASEKFLAENGIELAKDELYIRITNLRSWVNEAPEGEKQARLTAKSRILEGYTNKQVTLDLSDLSLTTLPDEIFNGLTNLENLDLDGNNFSTLPGGIFNGLTNLENLYLGRNNFSTLPDGIFNGLTNLKSLSLFRNKLSMLSEDAFNGLTNLEGLDLAYNQLNTLPEGVFNGLINLKQLLLYRNNLSMLPEGVFNGLANLADLNLAWNHLSTLLEGLFNGLTNLKQLKLSKTYLSTLPEGVFNGLTNLEQLKLSKNHLSTLPDGIFNSLTRLNEVRLSHNRFDIQAVSQIKHLYSNSNIKIQINVYEPARPVSVTHNLTIMDNLKEVLKQANSNYQLKLDWNKVPQNNIFNEFLKKVSQMADANQGAKGQADLYRNLAIIIIAMDQSPELCETCFNIAGQSIQTCGDRIAFGFIQMQLQVKLYKPNKSLSELFAQQKAVCAQAIIFDQAKKKVKSATGVIDEIEVYLTYIKHLKDYLQVEIDSMLYEALSDVTAEDIQVARDQLDETLTDDYVYAALVDSDIAKKRYASEFEAILNQPEFDTLPLDVESDSAYSTRMKNLDSRFTEAKVNFLKEELNYERILESLPQLAPESND